MSIKRILKTKKCQKFINYLKSITDTRQKWKIKHHQYSIIFLVVLAMLSGCNKFKEYYCFGLKHYKQLKKFVEFPNGIPSHDTMERTMHRINPKELNDIICNYTIGLVDEKNIHVCIDGKFVKATKEGKTKVDAIDIVSVFVGKIKLSLYSEQTRTSENDKNELPVIKRLLDILYEKYKEKHFVFTIDAIAAVNPILSKIVSYGWDYVICIKSRSKHGTGFYENIVDEFNLQKDLKYTSTLTTGNGRIEKRKYYVIHDISNLIDKENWPTVKSIGKVNSNVENIKNKVVSFEDRYYLFSKKFTTSEFEMYQRAHWQIESFHNVLDNSFNEDRMRMKKGSSTLNTNLLRKLVWNIISISVASETYKSYTGFRDKHRLSSPIQLLYIILNALKSPK